ncbi:Transposon Tf2-1 polyprotein [Ceratobasidium sp. AG-Ba]|nr:Transposon Tf2-1 polyprotein [Ceratobasidium sp. AG-Ba]
MRASSTVSHQELDLLRLIRVSFILPNVWRLVPDKLRSSVNLANEKIKHYYDLKHRSPEDIKVGDKVWLDARNIKTERPVAKLSAKKIGPYKVLKREGTHAFKLDLPHTLRVHPVFHTALVSLKKEDPFGRDPPQPPAEVTPDGKEEYEVEKILDSRKRRNQIQYLVHWKGYGPESNTWEPIEHLDTAMEAVKKFHRENPRAIRHPDLEEGGQVRRVLTETTKPIDLDASSNSDAYGIYMKMFEQMEEENPGDLIYVRTEITCDILKSKPKASPIVAPEMNLGPDCEIDMEALGEIKDYLGDAVPNIEDWEDVRRAFAKKKGKGKAAVAGPSGSRH